MPDTSPADVFTWLGALIAGAVSAWGLRHGEKDRKTAPAPEPRFAGITANLIDSAPFRDLAADVKGIRSLLVEEARLATERREQEEQDKIKERLDQADQDRRRMMEAIEDLRREGAQHPAGRPLREA